MAAITLIEAITQALAYEMKHDENVIVLGEDVGINGGVFRATAGLQQIPEDLYEASRIDGANGIQQFWNITIPLISPTLFLVTLLVFLRSLTTFGQIHLLTQGGPADSTMVFIYRIYQDAFFNFRQTYAAAQSVILFLVLLILALLQFRFIGYLYLNFLLRN